MTLLGTDDAPNEGGVVARQVMALNVLVPNQTIAPIVVTDDGREMFTNLVLRKELLLTILNPSFRVISASLLPLNASSGTSVSCGNIWAYSLNETIFDPLKAVPMEYHRNYFYEQ